MARKLNAKQVKLLDSYRVKYAFAGSYLRDFLDLTQEHLAELVALNDYETVYQDINRYITDKAIEEMH